MARVLVTGSQGLFGCTLVPLLSARGHKVIAHGRRGDGCARADLAEAAQTAAMLSSIQPEAIINLAAVTSVDICERQPHLAYLGNVRIVENLAAWIRLGGHKCHLVQISSDHVYDGPGPHSEEQINLSNCYAFSKYAGELAAATVPSTVLRTNFFGRSRSPDRTSFSDWIVSALRKREPIRVFEDVAFSPLSMERLASLILLVLDRHHTGVFNVGSRDGASKADFAFALAAALNLPSDGICRGHTSDAALGAYRPKDMRMNCSRFERTFGVSLPRLTEEIESMRSYYDEQA